MLEHDLNVGFIESKCELYYFSNTTVPEKCSSEGENPKKEKFQPPAPSSPPLPPYPPKPFPPLSTFAPRSSPPTPLSWLSLVVLGCLGDNVVANQLFFTCFMLQYLLSCNKCINS